MKQGNEQTPLKLSKFVKATETQDGAVLLDIRQGVCFSVNPVGALIWRQLGDGTSPLAIAQHLSNVCSIPCQQAEVDVQEFVEQLKQRQLLRTTNDEVTRSKRFRRLRGMVGRFWARSGQNAV
jgi:hypothetical protein